MDINNIKDFLIAEIIALFELKDAVDNLHETGHVTDEAKDVLYEMIKCPRTNIFILAREFSKHEHLDLALLIRDTYMEYKEILSGNRRNVDIVRGPAPRREAQKSDGPDADPEGQELADQLMRGMYQSISDELQGGGAADGT